MRIEDSDILVDLHRGAGQVPPWQAFLGRVGDRAHAVMILLPEGAKPRAFQIFGAEDLPFAAEALLRLRYQRVYAAEELSGPRKFAFARILRVRVDGGGDVWLIVGRDMAEFSAAFALMISGLGPHLGVAAAHHLALAQMHEQAALADRLAERFQTGVLTLNAAGIILTATPVALQNLAKIDTVFGQIGAKLALPPLAAKTLAAILQNYEQGGLDVGALHLSPVQVLIQPYDGADHGRQSPIALVHLRHMAPRLGNAAKPLAQLAQITLSEARFALRLGEGLTIAEAGESLGLTLETARNYSKQIYAKTGLRGQSDLVRYLQNSVIPLI